MALYGEKGNGIRDIVLTFDDGPHPKLTPRLLDILAEDGVTAVFFVAGERVQRKAGRDIVARAHREGHVIGNHTFDHPNLRKLSRAKVESQIRRTHDLICEQTGSCDLFRPPYGATNATVGQVLQTMGYTQIMWNVDTMDWKYKKSGAWVEYGMKQVKAREDSVVLMHDIHKTTVDHVPSLLKRIRKLKKARFVLLD